MKKLMFKEDEEIRVQRRERKKISRFKDKTIPIIWYQTFLIVVY
jgi:hypothetical protein